jgi:hypothetical protein
MTPSLDPIPTFKNLTYKNKTTDTNINKNKFISECLEVARKYYSFTYSNKVIAKPFLF